MPVYDFHTQSYRSQRKLSSCKINRIKLEIHHFCRWLQPERWQGNETVTILIWAWSLMVIRMTKYSCPATMLDSDCILLLLFSWHPCRTSGVSLPWFPFSVNFSSSHYVKILYHRSLIPSSWCSFFSILLPFCLDLLWCNPTSQFRFSSPPFPIHSLGICSLCQFFISHSFHMTSPCQTSQSSPISS